MPRQDEIINFYSVPEAQEFQIEYHNPNYNLKTMPLKHYMSMCIVGCSGSGKTNILLNIIHKMSNTFNFIRIFTANKHEPLYELLEKKIEKPYLEIFEGIEEFNNYNVDNLEKGQYLFVFDDMVNERHQEKICDMYKRGRKLANKEGASVVYLSQSWYDIPKFIRKNTSYIILKKINGKLELANVIRDCTLGDISKEQLFKMYEYCCASKEDITNFLLIDKNAPVEYLFRKNFKEILDPEDFF